MENKDRRNGIGGSDIPVILGLSTFKTPYQLYNEKRGQQNIELDQSIKNRLELGNLLEPFVIKLFEQQENTAVTRCQEKLTHPDYSFLWGTIDGVSENNIIEVKTTVSINQAWKFGVPPYVLAQCVYYANLANAAGFKVIAYDRDTDQPPRVYSFIRDGELEKEIITKAVAFWSDVQNGVEPEATNYHELQQKFSTVSTGKSMIATQEDMAAIQEMVTLDRELKSMEKRRAELKLKICNHLGDAAIMVDELGNPLVTWNQRKTSRLSIDMLKEIAKDIYDKCKITTTTRNFSLKYSNQ